MATNRLKHVGWTLLAVLALAPWSLAAELSPVKWQNNVDEAWQTTQQHGRPMLVFVTRENCYYCTVMKNRTWANATVATSINQSFVPLWLDGTQTSPLLKELNVTAYPSTFIISPQAVILDRIDGYVAPEVLAKRLHSLRPTLPVASKP